jgi:hypothetical protein
MGKRCGTVALIVGVGQFWAFEVEHAAQFPVQASPFSA